MISILGLGAGIPTRDVSPMVSNTATDRFPALVQREEVSWLEVGGLEVEMYAS